MTKLTVTFRNSANTPKRLIISEWNKHSIQLDKLHLKRRKDSATCYGFGNTENHQTEIIIIIIIIIVVVVVVKFLTSQLWLRIIIIIITTLLIVSFHSVAVVLTRIHTKQIRINKHKWHNTKTQYKQYKTQYIQVHILPKHPHNCQNTHTYTHPHITKQVQKNHSTRDTLNEIVTIKSSTLNIRTP